MSLPYISADDIERAASMSQTVELMEQAFVALSSGQAVVPRRINMPLAGSDCALIMPVYLTGCPHYAVKTVSINPDNRSCGLARLHALITLFDAASGIPLAAMDGDSITALRTGAGAALATKLLTPETASTLALFGTGTQAQSQLEAMLAVRPVQRVLVFATSTQSAQRFIQKNAAKYSCQFIPAASAEQLSEADIICAATSSSTPVFEHYHLSGAVHINGVGSYHRGMAEVPEQTVSACTVIVDQKSACMHEAGDLIQSANSVKALDDMIYAELGQLLTGERALPATTDNTFFKSVGNAVQDLVVASHVFRTMALAH